MLTGHFPSFVTQKSRSVPSLFLFLSSKAGRKQVETKALDKQRWLLGANLFNGKVLIGCLVTFPKLVLIPHPRFMLACFAAFPTTRYVTIILVARLERSRTTPSHGREKRRTIQGWLTNRAVVSSCFFHFANLFLLECFSARLVFFFFLLLLVLSFFPQLRTIPAPRGGFFELFFSGFAGGCNALSHVCCVAGSTWQMSRGFFFSFGREEKVSRADVLAKGERGKL